MHADNVTTPFGRRPMTYAMLERQLAAEEIEPGASVDKWKLYRAICEARPKLGVSDRALSLLNALLTFYPKSELSEGDNLIVFPSNAQLSLRAHGMAEPTIRRHIAGLVLAGLLVRRDSANGKRFARRRQGGEVGEAFGFSLAPLLARARDIELAAAEVVAERQAYHNAREQLTICRRDIKKLLQTAEDEDLPGEWIAIEEQYRAILLDLGRNPSMSAVAETRDRLLALKASVVTAMKKATISENMNGNADYSERHKQNSNTQPQSELEPSFETKQGGTAERKSDEMEDGAEAETSEADMPVSWQGSKRETSEQMKPFPLGMVLSACPEIRNYGPGGHVGSWRELMTAAVVVRAMLGVSPSAYEQACAVLGPENAATVIACILERAGHINSAGGYLRDLTRRAERGEFALGPMLMAQVRANGAGTAKRA